MARRACSRLRATFVRTELRAHVELTRRGHSRAYRRAERASERAFARAHAAGCHWAK